MKVIGIMPVRNEDWCLGLTLRVALQWCDEMVVYLHACTDRSRDIVREIICENAPHRITVLHDSKPKWDEMLHRQLMLDAARQRGATHIAITDADEVLTGNLLRQNGFGQGVYFCGDGVLQGHMLQLPLYYLRGGLNRFHSDGIWGDRIVDVAFPDTPAATWSGDRFHSRAPHGVGFAPYRPVAQGEGGIMHLWGVEERRLRAKCALYKITERLRWPDKRVDLIDRMYNWAIKGEPNHPSYGTAETWSYAKIPELWWDPYKPLMRHLVLGAEPWQERACREAVEEHGAETFAGLDLFGAAGETRLVDTSGSC